MFVKKNIQPLIDDITKTVELHYLGSGKYARFLHQNDLANRKMGNNEYGCADAANILYSIGSFDRNPVTRAEKIKVLQSFQHENGLFDEGTHHPIHCTAHCVATLELFDCAPLIPLTALSKYKTEENLYSFLENLAWTDNPWSAAHQGAGIYAAFILTGNATLKWQDCYFSWLESHTDPRYGIGFTGAIDTKIKPISHHLNGWFHYLFNFGFAHRPIPYAKQAVDTCIDLYKNKTELTPDFGTAVGFPEIDWIYTLHRASKQEGYRVEESKNIIREFAEKYIQTLFDLPKEGNVKWNDLHQLFGTVCALCELQSALPGEVVTDYPLKLVLDRRPFI